MNLRHVRGLPRLIALLLALVFGTAQAATFNLTLTGGLPGPAAGGTGSCGVALNSVCRYSNVVIGAGSGPYQRDALLTITRLTNSTITAPFDNEGVTYTDIGGAAIAGAHPEVFAPTVTATPGVGLTTWAGFTLQLVAPGTTTPSALPGTVFVTSFDTDGEATGTSPDPGKLREFVEYVGADTTGLASPTGEVAGTAVDGGANYIVQASNLGVNGITNNPQFKVSAIYSNVSSFRFVIGGVQGKAACTSCGRLSNHSYLLADTVLNTPVVDGYKSVKLTTDADASGTVTAGDTLTYTLSYVNTGNTNVTNFQITDTLPANVTVTTGAQTVTAGTGSTALKNALYTGAGLTNTLLATGATLGANSTVTVSIPVTVGSAAAGTTLNNQAGATGVGISATPSDNVDNTTAFPPTVVASAGWTAVPTGSVAQTQTATLDATTVAVLKRADLGITKTDYTATALTGGPVTYTVRVVNNGPDAVTAATVTDPVPAGLSGVTWTCAASTGSSCAAASGSGGLNTTVNLLNAGVATFTYRGTVAASSGTLVNTASVAVPAGANDLVTGNNSATDTDTVTPSICAARGGTLGTDLLWSSGNFGSVPAGSSTNPPTVRNLTSVATGTDIRTDYTFVDKTPLAAPNKYSPEDGEYNLSNSTSYRQDGAWHVVPDHTSGDPTGQMMVVNAGTGLSVFYQQTITVVPNTNYELSAWIINLIANNAAILPNVSIEIDRQGFDDDNNAATADGAEGQIVYASGDIPNTGAPLWRYTGYIFNSGGASQITVRFRNNNSGGGGNDLALDDLSFTSCSGLPVGSVSGTLYRDRNNSGTFDVGGPDSRLGANIAVSLTDTAGGVTVTVNTDANGNYTFVNVPAGTYKVWVATADPDLGGLTPNTPAAAQYTNVTLASGASLTGQNFGFNAAGLVLTKGVRNCGAIASGSACPSGAAFSTAGTGKPGEVLEYCITYANPGALAAGNVVLTDLVPGNTDVDLSGYAAGRGIQQTVGGVATALTSAADTDAGNLTASQLTLRAGSVAAGASGQVCFRSKIK